MRNFEDLQIAVAGTGYVGLSIATLLAQHHKVTAVDIIPEKVEKINNRISPIQDEYIEKYFAEKELNLTATLDGASAYKDADFVVIAAPTNYDPVKNFFDTHHIENVIDLVLSVNPKATMVIKSTIPVGYCRSLYVKYAQKFAQMEPLADGKRREFRLLFSPELIVVIDVAKISDTKYLTKLEEKPFQPSVKKQRGCRSDLAVTSVTPLIAGVDSADLDGWMDGCPLPASWIHVCPSQGCTLGQTG